MTTDHDKEPCYINKLAGFANAKEALESEEITSFVDARACGVCFHGGHLNFGASRQSDTPKIPTALDPPTISFPDPAPSDGKL